MSLYNRLHRMWMFFFDRAAYKTMKEIEDWKSLRVQRIELSEKEFNRLVELLENPPEPNAALRALMAGRFEDCPVHPDDLEDPSVPKLSDK